MTRPARSFLPALLLLAALAGAGAWAEEPAGQPQVGEVSYQLICQCGCNMVLSECNHQSCPFAIPERKAIAERLRQGETPEAIIASYVEAYGRKILAQPTTQGFDLLAWLMPIAALLVGGIVVVRIVRAWARRPRQTGVAEARPQPAMEGPVSQSLIERVQRELRGDP